jgi:hypothetical protein
VAHPRRAGAVCPATDRFWLTGTYDYLAAVPGAPGLAFAVFNFHSGRRRNFYRAALAGEISGGAGENERVTQAL